MKKSLGLAAIALLCLLVIQTRSSSVPAVEDFHLDPTLTRVAFRPAPSTLLGVIGADWVDGRLYALDPMRSEVVVLEEGESGWSEVFSFGGKGNGPGKFRSPMDVLWLPGRGRVVVYTADQKAHYFTRDGLHIRDETLPLPCVLGRRTLAFRSPDDFWVSGNCAFPGTGGDTVFAVAAGRTLANEWTLVAKKPRYTLSGRFGTPFGIQGPTAGNSDGAFLTAGNDLCLGWLDPAAPDSGEGSVKDVCLQGDRFRAPVPPDYKPPPSRFGNLFVWPDPLPAVSEVALSGDHLVLVRMYDADSVLVERHDLTDPGSPGQALAGGPFEGLVGCRRYGCVWFRAGLQANRIGTLFFSELDAEDLPAGRKNEVEGGHSNDP